MQKVSRNHELALSFGQEQIWFIEQLYSGSSAYNMMPLVVHLKGWLDVAALEQSLNEVVRRHEILRTKFTARDGIPVQVIAQAQTIDLPIIDLQPLPEAERLAKVQRLVEEEAGKPFDLAVGPLLRVALLKLAEESHVLVLAMHHIISDGWSYGLLLREAAILYEAFSRDWPSPLPELTIQYADFANWQKQCCQSENFEAQICYWKQTLSGNLSTLKLPLDRERPTVQSFRTAKHSLKLPIELSQQLRTMSAQRNNTLYITLLTAFKVLLFRYTGQEDIIVGSPIVNRDKLEFENLIGFFLNTLVLRTNIAGDPSFLDLLHQVRNIVLDAFAHKDLPFEKLVEEVQPKRDLSRSPLFQVCFNMANFPYSEISWYGLTAEILSIPETKSKFDLTLYVHERNQQIEFSLVYNSDLFEAARMVEMLKQLSHLLSQIVKEPERKISNFSLVTPSARLLLPDPTRALDFSPRENVHTVFSYQAGRYPDQIAVKDSQDIWTYKELEARSNQLANYLIESGIQPQDVVAIYGHRSASLIWALLGVLKAGAAFLILDPTYPTSRLIDYLCITEPKGWIQLKDAGELPGSLKKLLDTSACCCQFELPRLETAIAHDYLMSYSTAPPGIVVDQSSIAYVEFTSGTTGVPKAVIGTHAPLSHFFEWHSQMFNFADSDRFSMLSGLSHDPVLRDIFTPLWLGATLCIPRPEDLIPIRLAEWMRNEAISVAHLTPALGQILTYQSQEITLPALRYIFFAGDKLTRKDILRFQKISPSATYVNFYGATETPQAAAYFIIPEEYIDQKGATTNLRQVIPIRQGIQDVQLLVLNHSQQLAGIGEIGEICIRSPYLAKGYMGDAVFTQERFIINPFTNLVNDRCYKTGDLGRYLPDGSVEYIRRDDHQVQLRGFRIEIAEVELALNMHPAIQEVVVKVYENESDDKRLVAYIVPFQEGTLKGIELRSFLEQMLPSYMIPSAFVLLNRLPMTSNGKLDHLALLSLDPVHFETEKAFVAPRTHTEELMTSIWIDLLRVKEISIYDNFFELGGHSLIATQVISRIRQLFQIEIPLKSIFETPTVVGLSKLVEASCKSTQGLNEEIAKIIDNIQQLPDGEIEDYFTEA